MSTAHRQPRRGFLPAIVDVRYPRTSGTSGRRSLLTTWAGAVTATALALTAFLPRGVSYEARYSPTGHTTAAGRVSGHHHQTRSLCESLARFSSKACCLPCFPASPPASFPYLPLGSLSTPSSFHEVRALEPSALAAASGRDCRPFLHTRTTNRKKEEEAAAAAHHEQQLLSSSLI